jgi:hypothetical protein
MNTNRAFWDKVKKTDPKRVKPITGKQYSGNSPQPYYLVERMTDEFGMCGIGWGINILNERMERLADNEVLHVAVVELWYKHEGQTGSISQIGQTKACYKKKDGGLMVDEDAPKKSVTDALTKCMSYLGFAGDIFSGQWDDSKYVQELKTEFSHDHQAIDTTVAEKDLNNAVKKGTAELRKVWEAQEETVRLALKGKLAGWKEAAKKQDEAIATQP